MDDADDDSTSENRQGAPVKRSRDPDGADVPRDYRYKYKYKYEKNKDEEEVQDKVANKKDDESDEEGGKDENNGKDGKKDQDGDDGPTKKPKSRTPIIILIVIAVIAIIGGLIFWLMTRNQESTDDAYTEGNAVSIAPKVSGYVVKTASTTTRLSTQVICC